jgi:hypothetical protein
MKMLKKCRIWCIRTVNQAYVKILKWLCEALHRKRPGLGPSDWILLHENASAHKILSVKQFLAQKSVTEMEHPPSSLDLAPYDFWLFLKINSALKGWKFQDIEDIQKKSVDSIERYSTRGISKMFPKVAASLG